jgi:hypothetical protein
MTRVRRYTVLLNKTVLNPLHNFEDGFRIFHRTSLMDGAALMIASPEDVEVLVLVLVHAQHH